MVVSGPGALGLALAEELEGRGAEVRFVGRGGRLRPDRTNVVFDGRRGAKTMALTLASPTFVAQAELVFVAVKAFDLEAALKLAVDLPAGAVVIPLANGATWDIVRKAADAAPQCRWRLGFSTFGISEVGPGHFALKSQVGEVSFGPLVPGDTPTPMESALVATPGFFGWHGNIALLVRRKWIYNVVINSLSAARRLARNGELLADLPTLAAVFTEALALATELWGPFPQEARDLYRGLIQLIERTSDNENSMARDLRLGRPTESAFLAGLARDAKRFPLLVALHAGICK